MDYQTVIIERKDLIGSLILNCPQTLNVLTTQLAKDINSALLELKVCGKRIIKLTQRIYHIRR